MMKMKKTIFVAMTAVMAGTAVHAFVPQPFFVPAPAPFPQMPTPQQYLRQLAAVQGVDVSDVPDARLTTDVVVERIMEKKKREAAPRADAIVRQYMLSESDFAAALREADTPEKLLALRTGLWERMCQIALQCTQVGCTNEDAVNRASPIFLQLKQLVDKVDRLSTSERARFDELDKALQAQLQARNAAMQSFNNQMMSSLMNGIEQSNQQIMQSMQSMHDVTYPTVRSSSSSYKRICPVHGQEYDTRYGGCAWCRQPDFGGGKTTTMRCGVHGYLFDPAVGCPACNNKSR